MTAKTRRLKRAISAPPPQPPTCCRCTCQQPPDDRHTFYFEAMMDGVPAELSMIVIAKNGRDALGAAYLLADHFASECMKAIKKKGRS